ncbi:MAG: YeeE/YedE family protein [Proteobacteria bacterium]|nr:YeeE/YedE family protein [Pseudomonadota bacterium]
MRDFILSNAPGAVAIGGLLIGFFFGWIVFRTNFCTMGSISDFMSFGDFRRFRAWILAIATALIGAQLLNAYGIVDLSRSMYVTGRLDWFGNIAGGFLFGLGMVFAGGCASRNLARAGGGDLRSLLVLLVVGLFAYMSIGGLLGPLRADISARTSIDLSAAGGTTISAILSQASGLPASTAILIATAVIAGFAILYCLSDSSFRSSPVHIIAGIGIGLCVVAGWALTGLAYDEMAAQPISPVSLTFVRPAGDTLEWFERFTAGPVPSFAVTSTLGAMLGAFAASIISGRFRLTTFASPADTVRNLFGAALMGIGGVMALGCTIGQGVTGISTLALGSFLTFAAIVTGGMYGIRRMEAILLAEL